MYATVLPWASQLEPANDAGTGSVHDPEMVALAEVIAKINDLFSGDHPDSSIRSVATPAKDRLVSGPADPQ